MAETPLPKIAINGANTISAREMTRTSATVYTYGHNVSGGDGTATVTLYMGTDLAGNLGASAPPAEPHLPWSTLPAEREPLTTPS